MSNDRDARSSQLMHADVFEPIELEHEEIEGDLTIFDPDDVGEGGVERWISSDLAIDLEGQQ